MYTLYIYRAPPTTHNIGVLPHQSTFAVVSVFGGSSYKQYTHTKTVGTTYFTDQPCPSTSEHVLVSLGGVFMVFPWIS